MIGSGHNLLRNIRRNQTMSEQQKSYSKIRSSQQITLNTPIPQLKHIDTKLQIHQSQIDKNNAIIEELSSNFVSLKSKFENEKQQIQVEVNKNKLLRQELQRTNKLLKAKNSKIDDYTKKIADFQKQIEINKVQLNKNQEYVKSMGALRTKNATLQETLAENKSSILEKDKQINRLKQKICNMQFSKQAEDSLEKQLKQKISQIQEYKMQINKLQFEKDHEAQLKKGKDEKISKISKQLLQIKNDNKNLQSTVISLKKTCAQLEEAISKQSTQKNAISSKAKDKQSTEMALKSNIEELKNKCNELAECVNERVKQCKVRDGKIQKLNAKTKELQNEILAGVKEQQKCRQYQIKINELKNKSILLQSLYKTMLPQIQCPFGHQLVNPVTIIPCGHNYCLGCKKGYNKDCMECHGKLKIQAVYRNELMDDIIGIVAGVKQVMQLLK